MEDIATALYVLIGVLGGVFVVGTYFYCRYPPSRENLYEV